MGKKQVYDRDSKPIKGKFITEPDWTKNQIFAVDNHTCEVPEGKNYEEVLELIEQGDESVTSGSRLKMIIRRLLLRKSLIWYMDWTERTQKEPNNAYL